jgi:hypothetical protein
MLRNNKNFFKRIVLSMAIEKLLDLYSDYLLFMTKPRTATGLSSVSNGHISHDDRITRFLPCEEKVSKTLWF